MININTHPGFLFYNFLQLLGIYGIYQAEIEKPQPYRLSDKESIVQRMIPSKTGMLIIYVPAVVVAVILQMILPAITSSYASTVPGWMLLAHFIKRCGEVLYLHKYSGETNLDAARFIGYSYASTTLSISLVSSPSNSSQLGIILFIIGSLGNLYHHYLLASLRSGVSLSEKKKYMAPKGGMFEYVATPHYFFELVAWMGIALASNQLTAFLNFISMTCYLMARSYNQNQWNMKRFEEKEWPSSRMNMIPFLF
uniref:3-oxo-5-alpha-steroid 4-dehydrogenase C-terminal domain-containing protein n=1 Tax=Ditylum brightwellii TaxID=49249 RepID=A0A7S4RTC1_9STRA